MVQYQLVGLIFDTERKTLSLKLPDNPKRINPCLTALFSRFTYEVGGNLEKIRDVLAKIRETPTYHKLLADVSVIVKSDTGEMATKPCTVANLEIFIVFQHALKVKTPLRLSAWGLRSLLGLQPHLIALQHTLIVGHDIDCGHVLAQIKNLLGFLPKFCRRLFGLKDLEDALESLHRKRVWQSQRQIPRFFSDQFPTILSTGKSKAKAPQDDGTAGGHNMLNPKRTQEPKPKDDTTPFKTKPGRK